MTDQSEQFDPLTRLRGYRVRSEPDLSMAFIKQQFKAEIEKPHKQLAAVAAVWTQLVPQHLQYRAKLESLSRGVLNIAMDSAPHLYELTNLLKEGLEQRIIQAGGRAKIRKINLRLDRTESLRSTRPGLTEAQQNPDEPDWEERQA